MSEKDEPTSEPPAAPHREPFVVVDRVLANVAGVALFAMMLLTVVSSGGRFLFSMPIPDAEAVAEMLLVAVVFLPLAWTQAQRQHVEVTLFTDFARAEMRRRFIWFGCLVGFLAFSMLTYAMLQGAMRAYVTGDSYLGVNEIVTWPARAIAVVGLAAFVIRLALDLTIARFRAHEDIAGKADHTDGHE